MYAWVGLTVCAYVVTRMIELMITVKTENVFQGVVVVLAAIGTILVAIVTGLILLAGPSPAP